MSDTPDYSTASTTAMFDWPLNPVNTSGATDPDHTTEPVAQCFAPRPCTCPACTGIPITGVTHL